MSVQTPEDALWFFIDTARHCVLVTSLDQTQDFADINQAAETLRVALGLPPFRTTPQETR